MCFSAGGVESFLLWLLFLVVVIAVLKVVLPWILSIAGVGVSGPLLQIINIIVIGFVIAAVIVVVFALIGCLTGGGFGWRLR